MSLVLRGVALLIAGLCAWDPALSVSERAPIAVGVRVAALPPAHEAHTAAAAIARALGDRARVVWETPWAEKGWCQGVDLCVAVADGTADVPGLPSRPLLLVDAGTPSAARLVAVDAAMGHGAVERSSLRAWIGGGRAGDQVTVAVENHDVEAGRVTHTRSAAAVDVVDVPWWAGPDSLPGLRVRIDDGTPDGRARGVGVPLDAPAPPAEVLVWDARPSWQGTFVRRALAADPRLLVRAVHEVTPTRRLGQGLAGVPSDDELWRAAVVVLGGAEQLDGRAVARLERYVRGGGSLAVALDEPPGGAITRLLPEPDGEVRRSITPVQLAPPLRAGEVQPFTTALGDVALASAGDDPTREVVIERRLGRGRVVVSGALDAWRWRGDGAFDRFWIDTAVRLARESGPRAALRREPARAAAPGGRLTLVRRGGDRGPVWPAVDYAAAPASAGAASTLRVTPAATPGAWHVDVPGRAFFSLDVTVDGDRASAHWQGDAALPAQPPSWARLERLAEASGGRVVPAASAAAAIDDALDGVPRRDVTTRWHPMRAWWWFVPVVGALALDWWRRRRAGDA